MSQSRVRVMVFNATFNNISAISWQSILLVEEAGVGRKPQQSMINTTFCIILMYKLHYDIRPRFLSTLHTGEFVIATKQLILPLKFYSQMYMYGRKWVLVIIGIKFS